MSDESGEEANGRSLDATGHTTGELSEYLRSNPPRTLSSLSQTLRAINAHWLHGAAAIHGLGDGEGAHVPDFRSLPDRYRAPAPALPHVERVPLIYRLHQLRQLSTVAVTTHFGAGHTRLSHSLGVLEVTSVILSQLRKRPPKRGETELERNARHALNNDIIRTACLAYAVWHDAFHGPFGHSLDLMKDVFGGNPDQKLDDTYFHYGLSAAIEESADPVGQQLRASAGLWVGTARAEELLRAVQTLALRKDLLISSNPELYFLRQVVDSELDADRFDYLVRDGFYLDGQNHSEALAPLLDGVGFAEWRGREEDAPRVCLAFDASSEAAAQAFLGLRRHYYVSYYETPEKLAVDDMICHAVARILEAKGIPDTPKEEEEEDVRQIKRNLLMLTDDNFYPALLQLKAPKEAYDLLLRYQQRRFFEVVAAWSIDIRDVGKVKKTVGTMNRWISSKYLQGIADRGRRPYAATVLRTSEEDVAAAFRDKLDSLVPDDRILKEKVLRFAFQFWTEASFRPRQAFEFRVWQNLARNHEDGISMYADQEYKDPGAREGFRRHPPVHITTTSFFVLLDERDIANLSKEGLAREDILFFDEDTGRVEEKAIAADATSLLGEHVAPEVSAYPLVVSAPPSLIEILGRGEIEGAVKEELAALDWLVDRVLP